ncbi:probable 39S ribosomal protein L45, mitochondrial [Gigantopelta aegis]|uniref:probable 39S ribosomal protein L45, mitochondrial n=1 Tax=Gigantopelta aegis TaxID=1735272 RepID=UPI001B8881B5|nr:probable 39S ribosomal protein L45, mitochondrial [Gigantopelta aegis]
MAACITKVLGQAKHCQNIQSISWVLKSAPAVGQIRYPSAKHYDPKWRKQRREKVRKVDLPDFRQMMADLKMSPDEMRTRMKKEGRLPPRHHQDRPLNISATGAIIEEFVPPEGDGKKSLISPQGVKTKYKEFEKKGKSFMELRKVRQFEEDFDTKEFAQQAQDIVIEAQECLQDVYKNEDRLHDLVTEKAFPEMVFGLENKTFRWTFVESIEPPRVTQVRTQEMFGKDNLFAQITVRMHTKQILAVYDRFGRLMYGSDRIAKDVLEYVVLEKHIANEYGLWRIHGKIIPDWMPPREPLLKTFLKPEFSPLPAEETEEDSSVPATT